MSQRKLTVEQLVVGQMAANCYIVNDGNDAIVIDPGDDGQYILSKISVPLVAIVATHGHSDHVTAAFELHSALGAPFYIHEGDIFFLDKMRVPYTDPPPRVDRTIGDRDVLPLGLKVIHTPGHTPGSITLYSTKSKIAFVGDVVFADGAVGRTDFSYSNPDELTRSIHKIFALPKETVLYAGHGEPTTVSRARGV